MPGILIYTAIVGDKVSMPTKEVLGMGRAIAEKTGETVSAALLGVGVSSRAQDLIESGADTVYISQNDRLSEFKTNIYLKALEDVVGRHPDLVHVRLDLIDPSRGNAPVLPRQDHDVAARALRRPEGRRPAVGDHDVRVGRRGVGGRAPLDRDRLTALELSREGGVDEGEARDLLEGSPPADVQGRRGGP